jgi:hypothetical protein
MDRARPEAAPRILTLPGIVPRFLPTARVRHGKGTTFLHVGLKPPPPIITQKSEMGMNMIMSGLILMTRHARQIYLPSNSFLRHPYAILIPP